MVQEPLIRFPIACPVCSKEFLAEFPVAVVADALVTANSIRLYARCHDKAWDASAIEREQLREYLSASAIDA